MSPLKRVLSLFLLTFVFDSLLGCGGDAANVPKPTSNDKQSSEDQGSGTSEPSGSGTKPSGSDSRP